MKNELISIIVPVYNGEGHIGKCLDSILEQTFQNFKVYVVNDGSTDLTSSILQKYGQNEKIVIVHQENSGVSAARNLGLRLAKGDFISFVDADDIVESDYLSVLFSPFDNNDISLSVASYKSVDIEQDRVVIPSFKEGIFETDEAIEYLISEKGPQGYLWNKLFRASQIRNNNLLFASDIFMAEDLLFVIDYLTKFGKMYIHNKPVYNYMIYTGSSNKTRLSTLSEGYEKYFNNFLLCIERISSLLPQKLRASRKAILGREGRIAIQYLRANNLMNNGNKDLRNKLLQIAKRNKGYYFSGLDATLKAKVIYLLTLYFPLISKQRDRHHFN